MPFFIVRPPRGGSSHSLAIADGTAFSSRAEAETAAALRYQDEAFTVVEAASTSEALRHVRAAAPPPGRPLAEISPRLRAEPGEEG
jgi:hypothetical protein